jgi:hypothetical protein
VPTTEPLNGLLADGARRSVMPPPSPQHGKAKKHLPAVHGAISYLRWRSKYVREYKGGLYVAYNGKHHETPYNAVTVSEVRFIPLFAVHVLLQRLHIYQATRVVFATKL